MRLSLTSITITEWRFGKYEGPTGTVMEKPFNRDKRQWYLLTAFADGDGGVLIGNADQNVPIIIVLRTVGNSKRLGICLIINHSTIGSCNF